MCCSNCLTLFVLCSCSENRVTEHTRQAANNAQRDDNEHREQKQTADSERQRQDTDNEDKAKQIDEEGERQTYGGTPEEGIEGIFRV